MEEGEGPPQEVEVMSTPQVGGVLKSLVPEPSEKTSTGKVGGQTMQEHSVHSN